MDEQRSPDPAEEADVGSAPRSPDLELEPISRDGRFVYRLVAGFMIAILAVLLVGGWIKGAAASCGAGLIRPGATVIPGR
jgi:hypothetical protein